MIYYITEERKHTIISVNVKKMTKRLQSFYDKTLRKLNIDGNVLILLNKEKQETFHFTVKFEQFFTELVSKTGPVYTTCTRGAQSQSSVSGKYPRV